MAEPGTFSHGPRNASGSAAAAHASAREPLRRPTANHRAACHAISASRFNASAALCDGPASVNAMTAAKSWSVPWAEGLTSVCHSPAASPWPRAYSLPV